MVLIPALALASGDALRAALDHTGGVLALVSLTAAVVWGLIATHRVLLEPRHRLLAQGVHRALGTGSLGFLLLHVTLKVAAGHVSPAGALVPFGLGVRGSAGLIGLGTLAAYLLVVAGATGAARSAFAVPGQAAGSWRALHALAYPAWCAALLHGLNAGRPAAGWVVALYALCLAAVGCAVAVRLLPQAGRRRIARVLMAPPQPAPPRAAPTVPRQRTAYGQRTTYEPPPTRPVPPAPPAPSLPRPAPVPPYEIAPAYGPPYESAPDPSRQPAPSPPPPGEPWHARVGGGR
ncbi:hypothetical protein ACH429_13555 [Streptomyces pathocidini]|uniref:Cytochrome b/b6 domain-containing protein n=1 Tax=Streptomyces pathocidini TaxID=1650571 RepID=A0ABW7URN2_9ACTN